MSVLAGPSSFLLFCIDVQIPNGLNQVLTGM
jgi:hypothetical protein